MKKIIVLSFLLLVFTSLIWDALARGRSSSSSRSSSSYSRSSSSSSSKTSSSSYSSPSFSKPATKRATNTSWTPTYSRISSSSDFSSRFSATDMMLLYLLVSGSNSTNASDLSESEKQKIIDEYNKDPSKYEDKLATCWESSSQRTEFIDVNVKDWNLIFSWFNIIRKSLLGDKESFFTNINDKTVNSFSVIDSKEVKESKLEGNCLVTVTKKTRYNYKTQSDSNVTIYPYFPVSGEKIRVIVDWVTISNPETISANIDNKNVIFQAQVGPINETSEQWETETYKFTSKKDITSYKVSYEYEWNKVEFDSNDNTKSLYFITWSPTTEVVQVKDSTFDEVTAIRWTWKQTVNIYNWMWTETEKKVDTILTKSISDLKIEVNWVEVTDNKSGYYIISWNEAWNLQEDNSSVGTFLFILLWGLLFVFFIALITNRG